jgi:hypothetical protein
MVLACGPGYQPQPPVLPPNPPYPQRAEDLDVDAGAPDATAAAPPDAAPLAPPDAGPGVGAVPAPKHSDPPVLPGRIDRAPPKDKVKPQVPPPQGRPPEIGPKTDPPVLPDDIPERNASPYAAEPPPLVGPFDDPLAPRRR